jgi:hypothetical protein
MQCIQNRASFHPGRNRALQFAPGGRQSGSFQNVSGRWIVIQREQKCKAIWARVETTPKSQNGLVGAGLAPAQGDRQGIAPTVEFEYTPIKPFE